MWLVLPLNITFFAKRSKVLELMPNAEVNFNFSSEGFLIADADKLQLVCLKKSSHMMCKFFILLICACFFFKFISCSVYFFLKSVI